MISEAERRALLSPEAVMDLDKVIRKVAHSVGPYGSKAQVAKAQVAKGFATHR
jgi:hypothetical protein